MIDTSRTPEQRAETDDAIEQARQVRSRVLMLADKLDLFAETLDKQQTKRQRGAEGERRS